MTLMKHVYESMLENNQNNDGSFSDWESAENAIEAYGSTFTGECDSDEEVAVTKEALQMIIDSDGEDYEKAATYYNVKIWGTNFSSNRGVEIYGG